MYKPITQTYTIGVRFVLLLRFLGESNADQSGLKPLQKGGFSHAEHECNIKCNIKNFKKVMVIHKLAFNIATAISTNFLAAGVAWSKAGIATPNVM